MGKDKRGATDLENTIIKFIRCGFKSSQIKRMLNSGEVKNVSEEDINRMVDVVCEEYPNYDLIQKIMRSKLAIDKNDEASKVYITDVVEKNVSTIAKRRLTELFDSKFNLSSRLIFCDFKYLPNENFILKKSESEGCYIYNTFDPPLWYKEHFYSNGKVPIKKENKLPEIYHKYLNHLVGGDKKSYNYILDWLANGIKDRNYCILVTIGKSGIGKGVLGEIMRHLFGSTNYQGGVRSEIFKSKFNSQLLNKRLVYLDEIKIANVEQENKLKLLINEFIEVEKKGVDAQEVRNFTSFYLSSNNLDALKISGDDRRFSIVDLTEKPLLECMTTEEIVSLSSEENIDRLARYLYYRPYDKIGMMKVFKSARTEVIRSSSLNAWEEYIMDEYSWSHIDKWVPVDDVAQAVADKFGFMHRPPGHRAFERLQNVYPERIEIKRARLDGKRRRYEIMFKDDGREFDE